MSASNTPEYLNDSDPSYSDETKLNLSRQAGEFERGQLAKQAIEQLNYKVNIPYGMVRTGEKSKHTFANLKEAFAKGNWKGVVTIAFGLLFGNKANIDALGMFSRGVEQLQPDEQADVIEQVEKIDMSSLGWEKKLKTSLVATSIDYSLFRRGYDRVGTLQHDKKRTRRIEPGTSLQDVVDRKILKKMAEESDGEPVLLGPLSHLQTLDCPCYLYFSKEGYPMYVAPTDTENPRVPLFEKTRASKGPEGEDMDLEARVNYLKGKLERGDVVLSATMPGKYRDPLRKMFADRGREAQKRDGENTFFAIHGIVYLGDGNLVHVEDGGHHFFTLKDMIIDSTNTKSTGWASAITASRLNASKEQRDAFATAAAGAAKEKKFYDYWGAFVRGKEIEKKHEVEDVSIEDRLGGKGAICVDVIAEGAQSIEGETKEDGGLASKISALEMYEYLTPVVAMNFKREG